MAASFRQLAGIPPSTASVADSVLLIVDAQGEYADGHLKITNIARSRPALQKLYERYRDAGGHVVHIVHEVSSPRPRARAARAAWWNWWAMTFRGGEVSRVGGN
jgi:nicotinamidase-related amidase